MGFFSELKSDLSQAAKTILPEEGDLETSPDTAAEQVVTPEKPKSEAEVKKDLSEMLDHLDDIKVDELEDNKKEEPSKPETVEEPVKDDAKEEPEAEEVSKEEAPSEDTVADLTASLSSKVAMNTAEAEKAKNLEKDNVDDIDKTYDTKKAYETNDTNYVNYNNGGFDTMDIQQQTPTDETASITEGMKIVGNLETTGSLELIGKITGNVTCLGKLNVTGEIEGDSKAAEIYAEAARITGEVRSNGSVKIGQSTVVIGNIFATSAVIAGAVKGDIDVPGPVVLDTTAIVMGNIKSQSVQINNGAVIEGNCSQSYAEVNPSAFFDGLKGNK